MAQVKALVLTGFGLNCDHETAFSLERSGAVVERVHLNDLLAGQRRLGEFQLFIIGGGFSWGDEHGAGVIMAMRLKHRLEEEILEFVERGGLVFGICNGFQVLVNLGLLPFFKPGEMKREIALINNDSGNFRDQWVHLRADHESPCVITRNIDVIELPVRHGEGKFHAEADVVKRLVETHQVILRYCMPDGVPAGGSFPWNPNGSIEDIAGICDPTGRIAGLMPHPEAFNNWTNHPDWTRQRELNGKPKSPEGQGIGLFRNAVAYFS